MKRYLPLAILALGLVAFFALGGPKYLSLSALAEHRQTLTQFVETQGILAIFVYITVYALSTAFSLPGGVILTIAGGFLFGTIPGTLFTVFAATVGATGIFFAARTAFRDFFRQKAGNALQKFEAGFQDNAVSYLLILRLVPLFPFWLVNIVPALIGVTPRLYILTTFFGIIPGTFVYTSVGSGLGTILDAGGTPDLGIIFEPSVLTPIIGLALLSLIPVIYKKVKHAKI